MPGPNGAAVTARGRLPCHPLRTAGDVLGGALTSSRFPQPRSLRDKRAGNAPRGGLKKAQSTPEGSRRGWRGELAQLGGGGAGQDPHSLHPQKPDTGGVLWNKAGLQCDDRGLHRAAVLQLRSDDTLGSQCRCRAPPPGVPKGNSGRGPPSGNTAPPPLSFVTLVCPRLRKLGALGGSRGH